MDIRPSTAAPPVRLDLSTPRPPEPRPTPDRDASTTLQPAVQVAIGDREAETRTGTDTKRQFTRDPDTDALVFQVMDPVSGEVFLQLPDEATLRARVYARELEARTSPDAAGSTVAIA